MTRNEELFATRTKKSLTSIISPKQDLTFSQLKIYYEEKKYDINDNFLKQLNLIMEDGKYNYLAYLLADVNDISIKVATYSGNDAYDLIESEEYGETYEDGEYTELWILLFSKSREECY